MNFKDRISKQKSYSLLIAALLILALIQVACAKEPSVCIKKTDVKGLGQYPYNFRIIDDKLYAGGNLFNPVNRSNSLEKVRSYVKLLKGYGATSIVALNVPLRYYKETVALRKLAKEFGLQFYECRMTGQLVPTPEQTEKILKFIDNKAYVCCQWGADRTGAIVAKYLRVKKGYSGYDAWKAVVSGGTHAGILGGLKEKPKYKNLILYFWPEVKSESKKVCSIYRIKYNKR